MSVRLTSQENRVALFDSVTGIAFGPTFADEESAEDFLAWVSAHNLGLWADERRDVRAMSPIRLVEVHERWTKETK